MNLKKYFGPFSIAALTVAFISGCATNNIMSPPQDNYGLSVESAYNGEPLIIDSNTSVLLYEGRLYYFQNQAQLDKFKENPDYYMTRYQFDEIPIIVPSLVSDYGLRTNCAYNGDPIVVSKFTPALQYMGRIYYFAHTENRETFMKDPQMFVAKFGANKVPKIISPIRSDYGVKTVCAASGIPILVGPHTPALEYMGRIYYFSDLPSMEAFRKDPQAYSNKKFNSIDKNEV